MEPLIDWPWRGLFYWWVIEVFAWMAWMRWIILWETGYCIWSEMQVEPTHPWRDVW